MSSIPPIRHVTKWFYRKDGTNHGPIDQASFDELVASGVIHDETYVWHPGWEDWRVLGSISVQGSYLPELEVVEDQSVAEEPQESRVIFSSTETITSSSSRSYTISHQSTPRPNKKSAKGLGCAGLFIAFIALIVIVGAGVIFFTNVTQNDKDRLGRFQDACRAGNLSGCYNAGRMYQMGDGITANTQLAMAFFRTACAQKHGVSCHQVGLYEQTKVVWDPSNPGFRIHDAQGVLKLFEEGCQGGYPPSCTRLKELKIKIEAP